MTKEEAFDKYSKEEILEAAWEMQQKEIESLEAQVAVTTSDLQAALVNEERYEKLRKLQPREFGELWAKNFNGRAFDELVDEL